MTKLDAGERLAHANGIALCYRTFGRDDAPPMLMIEGSHMTAWDDAFCESLAARGFRVIRFDNRDSGKSTWMDVAPYLLKDMANDAVGLLDALGIASAHVVGVSFGGMIAQEMAIGWPERVRTLTTMMSSTGDPALAPPTREGWDALMYPVAVPTDAYMDSFCRNMAVLRGAAFPRDARRDRSRAERNAARGLSLDGAMRQRAAVAASGSRREQLPGIRMPVLVIHGTDDPAVPLAAGEATADLIPGARLVVIEHMGHALPIEVWIHVVDAIEQTAKQA